MFRRPIHAAAAQFQPSRTPRRPGRQATSEGDPALKAYRDHLVEAQQKAQDDYDKTLVLLAGGAFGLSLALVEKMLPGRPYHKPEFLLLAWVSWGASLACTLASFLVSHHALRRCIDQHDLGKLPGETPGGLLSHLTTVLNIVAGVLFVLGLAMMSMFVFSNLGKG